MLQLNNDNPIRILNARQDEITLPILAGISCLYLVPAGLGLIWAGAIPLGALSVAIPAFLSGLVILTGRKTPDVYLALLPDRIVLTKRDHPATTVKWTEVMSISWPMPSLRVQDIRLKSALIELNIDLNCVPLADRAMLIRCIRLACTDVEQRNWEAFCAQTAIRLLPSDDTSQRAGKRVFTPSLLSKGARKLALFAMQHPFQAGLTMPFWPIRLLLAMMHREICWALSASWFLTAVINIRIFWGAWLSPFTEICLTISASLFLLGAIVSPTPLPEKNQGFFTTIEISIWWLVLIVGIPSILNVTFLEWLPPYVGMYAPQAFMFGSLLFVFARVIRQHEAVQEQKSAEILPELELWAKYEAGQITGPETKTDLDES